MSKAFNHFPLASPGRGLQKRPLRLGEVSSEKGLERVDFTQSENVSRWLVFGLYLVFCQDFVHTVCDIGLWTGITIALTCWTSKELFSGKFYRRSLNTFPERNMSMRGECAMCRGRGISPDFSSRVFSTPWLSSPTRCTGFADSPPVDNILPTPPR